MRLAILVKRLAGGRQSTIPRIHTNQIDIWTMWPISNLVTTFLFKKRKSKSPTQMIRIFLKMQIFVKKLRQSRKKKSFKKGCYN